MVISGSSLKLVGSPSLAPGTYNYKLKVTDTGGVYQQPVNSTYTVPAGPNNVSLPGTITALVNYTAGTSLATVAAIGGTSPFTYAVVGNANLTFSGAVLQVNTSPSFSAGVNQTFKVQVTDAAGLVFTDSSNRTLTVPAGPSAITFTGTTIVDNAAAGTFVGTLGTTNGTPPDTYVCSNGKFTVTGSTVTRSSTGSLTSGVPESLNFTSTDQAALSTDTSTNGQGPFSVAVTAHGAGTQVTTFQLVNFSASASKSFKRLGVPMVFAKGYVPNGNNLTINQAGTAVAAQFDERVTWSDGSLKFCVCHMRDDQNSGNFNGGETRTYSVVTQSGAFDNTGTKTLADITGATDFNVTFASVIDYLGNVYGSGAFTASFNTQSAIATRVYKYHSGPVCESWKVWGMAVDNGTSVADTHLKTVWYVSLWKDGTGAVVDIEYAAEVCLDWWSLTNLSGSKAKSALGYTATLRNNTLGSPVIQAYTLGSPASTKSYHPYRSHWMTVQMSPVAADNAGRRFWLNNTPTLIQQFNKTYAGNTKLFAPYDPTFTPASAASQGMDVSYTPCSNMKQRADISQTGGYQGRGPMTNFDAMAFMRQGSNDYKCCRIEALAGLSLPYHYRSNYVAGPSGADIANTVIPFKLFQKGVRISDDFYSSGMPHSMDASVQSPVLPNTLGFAYTYVAIQGVTGVQGTAGQTGVWVLQGTTEHGYQPSYFAYMLEGERHYMETTLDIAFWAAHMFFNYACYPFVDQSGSGFQPFQTALGIPTGTAAMWSGIGSPDSEQDVRTSGWAILNFARAAMCVPDSDPQSGPVKLLCQQNTKFWNTSVVGSGGTSWLPTDLIALGFLGMNPPGNTNRHGNWAFWPWMSNIQLLAWSIAAMGNEDSDALNTVNAILQNSALLVWNYSRPYASSPEHWIGRYNATDAWNGSTHVYLSPTDVGPVIGMTPVGGANSNTLTWNSGAASIIYNLANDDVLYPATVNGLGTLQIVPVELTPGTPYYVVNQSGFNCQLAASLGGTPLTLTYSFNCTASYNPANGFITATLPVTVPTSALGMGWQFLNPVGSGPDLSKAQNTGSATTGTNTTTVVLQIAKNLTMSLTSITAHIPTDILSFTGNPASAAASPANPAVVNPDSDPMIAWAAIALAYQAGATNIPSSLVDTVAAWIAPVNKSTFPTWALKRLS